MTFTSFNFLLLLPLFVALYQVVPRRARTLFLLVVSYACYCAWSWKAAVALAAVTVFTFVAGKFVGDSNSEHSVRFVFPLAIQGLVFYLAIFKIAAVAPVGRFAGYAIPLGLSYYTFKLMSYLIDVHWGKIPASTNLVEFSAAIAFFPQLSAGPIQRPADFLEQVPPPKTALWKGAARFVWGLAKKVLIADNLAPAVDYVYSHLGGPTGGQTGGLHGAGLVAGFYLFPLQLYADFSALSDMALGMGMMFGIHGPENFNRPYTATSIGDFWRRWHMSLTTWLADYVFTPLRMATRAFGTSGLVFSIVVNMVAIGIWHGLTWGYLVFGLVNAVYLVLDALTSRKRANFFKSRPGFNRLGSWLGWLLTIHLVFIAMVFFRARSVADAIWLLGHAASQFGRGKHELSLLMTAAGMRALLMGLAGYAVLELAERYRPDQWWLRFEANSPRWVQWPVRFLVATCVVVALFLLTVRSANHASAFLYQVF